MGNKLEQTVDSLQHGCQIHVEIMNILVLYMQILYYLLKF